MEKKVSPWYSPFETSDLFSVFSVQLANGGIVFPQEDDSAEKNLDIWAGDGNGDTKAKKVTRGSLMHTSVCI